ncbi:hypothetical protein FACS1894162_6950 [Bacteroidia bacterium]|nr:hypothetical protein FACS1894162_6950 [Bacteroidia bacterium]
MENNFYTLLILQLTAHLLADFNFQPQKWCETKDRKLFSKEHLYHAFVVFVCSWVLSLMISFWWAALLIALFHLGLDVAKGYFFRKNILKKYLFFIDQALHFAFITLVVFLFGEYEYGWLNIAFIAFAIIACTKPANIFIKKFMEASGIISKKEGDNTLMNAGRVIGSLERILSFVLILSNQWAAIGFIIAAKTILRFRDTQTAQTEYVLIGSLLSFGIAIILGIGYQFIK